MFGANLECGIKSVKVKVIEHDGRVFRRCRVVLVHDFDDDIAAELGKDAKRVRESLINGSVTKAELPIDKVAAFGAFTSREAGPQGGGVSIGTMVGVKAVASAAKDDTDEPTIAFEFEFNWQEDAWVFLGRHCSAVADVVLTKSQQSLGFGESAQA